MESNKILASFAASPCKTLVGLLVIIDSEGWWGDFELVLDSNADDGSENDVYRVVDVDWFVVLKRNGGFVLPESKRKKQM